MPVDLGHISVFLKCSYVIKFGYVSHGQLHYALSSVTRDKPEVAFIGVVL